MTSFLRKAARMNLVAMDFVLQVTVVELVLGALLDDGRTLSFELSRGTKASCCCCWCVCAPTTTLAAATTIFNCVAQASSVFPVHTCAVPQ